MNVGYVQYYFHQFNIDAPYAPKIPPHFSFFSHDLADVWHFCRQLGRNRTENHDHKTVIPTKPPPGGLLPPFGDIPQDVRSHTSFSIDCCHVVMIASWQREPSKGNSESPGRNLTLCSSHVTIRMRSLPLSVLTFPFSMWCHVVVFRAKKRKK